MREVKVKELTRESFAPYGTYEKMLNPNTIKIGKEPIEFFRDMVPMGLGNSTTVSFSICRVLKRPLVVDCTESHSYCGEANLPIDGDILIHVAPATPNGVVPADQIEIFRVPKGTMITMRPGVWHHAPFACGSDCVNTLIVLPERTYANDCKVVNLESDDQVKIVED